MGYFFLLRGLLLGYYRPAMTKEQLKTIRGQRTQEQMADLLGAPISTYRKWEQGHRKVPAWVDSKLVSSSYDVPMFSLNNIQRLEEAARKESVPVTELIRRFIDEGLSKLPAIMLLGIVAWQAFSSPDNGIAKRFATRRKGGDFEMLEVLEGGDA